ncbi:MAG TPA: hypothetical protein VGN07_00120 [Steroidobacteraceae bacterium]|jgi:hypothetical protein
MYRNVSERLMTIEEAMRLSDSNAGPHEKFERPSIWSWQTVARAMAQIVTDEQVDEMVRKGGKK